MPLQAIALDERILQRGSEAQRDEWKINVRELLANAVTNLQPRATLRIGMTEREFVLAFEAEDGRELGSFPFAYELLAEQITDYIDIVRQITAADSLNQMEALDMAKKVTHDRAGRIIKRALRDVGLDLETSRRLFTLLLSLKVDTTRLPGVYGHRRAH